MKEMGYEHFGIETGIPGGRLRHRLKCDIKHGCGVSRKQRTLGRVKTLLGVQGSIGLWSTFKNGFRYLGCILEVVRLLLRRVTARKKSNEKSRIRWLKGGNEDV